MWTIRRSLVSLVRQLDKPLYGRYIHLMIRDRSGIERWERTQTVNLRRFTGLICDRLLGIK